MKKVIDGKRYDTATAALIAEYEHSDRSDFAWFDEALYRTKKGRFFLAGEGHANSRWAENYGTTRGPGQGIIALSAEEALAWCERYNVDADTIANYFKIEEA